MINAVFANDFKEYSEPRSEAESAQINAIKQLLSNDQSVKLYESLYWFRRYCVLTNIDILKYLKLLFKLLNNNERIKGDLSLAVYMIGCTAEWEKEQKTS